MQYTKPHVVITSFGLHKIHFHCLPQNPTFNNIGNFRKKPLENIVGKEEIENSIFLLFQQSFLSFQTTFQFLSHIYLVVCKGFQTGLVKDLIIR